MIFWATLFERNEWANSKGERKKDGATPILASKPKRLARNPPKPPPSPRYEQKRNSAGVGDEDVEHFCPKMGSPKNTHGGRAFKAKVSFCFFKGVQGQVFFSFPLSTSHLFVRWDD